MEINGKVISNYDTVFEDYFELYDLGLLTRDEVEKLFIFQSVLEIRNYIPYSETYENKSWKNIESVSKILNWLDKYKDDFKNEVSNELAWRFLDKLRDRGRTVEIHKRLLETMLNFPTSDYTGMSEGTMFCPAQSYRIHEKLKKQCIHLTRTFLKNE